MKLRLPLVLATVLVAGACSRDVADQGRAGQVAAAGSPGAMPASAARAPLASLPMAHRFGALPDRGNLVAYPAARVVRHDGAYTWHRADLSEAHARNSIGGVLSLRTPSGEEVQFRYERHVEHSSGDWTWIGAVKGRKNEEAIITFGADAAFGAIAQPGREPLRLTIRDGVSWLVETDPRQIALLDNVGTRPKKPDYLVAPELAAATARRGSGVVAAGGMLASSSSAASSTAAPANTIDLVLGYTPGFVSYYGGESAALTRLNNMVEITNEAYVNSQIDARVRLVRAVAVNYTDTNANQAALEELTGFRAPSTQLTPSAAFAELRAARDQYGADLVSLVRRFNTPENDGCGIAWLIGGGRRGTISTSSEYFGYSVVSDGRDAGADGKTYFCRDETLAHEIGHNLGSAHDRDTSDGDDNVLQNNEYGIFDYSFGYKTTAGAGNFYTVMAYGDSGQTRYRVFSNPRTTFCGGLACGIENAADNARSITQTVQAISSFRAKVVPDAPAARAVPNDYDGDGRSDIYWRNVVTGVNDIWFLNGAALVQAATVHREADVSWSVLGSGDFNGDRRADVLWRHGLTGQLFIQHMNGSQVLPTSGPSLAVANPDWKVIAIADFDGDGISDIYWRNTSGGFIDVWLMGALTPREARTIHRESDPAWEIVGSSDFNGDGRSDIFWRNSTTGRNLIHLMNGAAVLPGSAFTDTVSDTGWKIAALRDFDGDGRADVYWRHSVNGLNYLWTMNGSTVTGVSFVHAEPDQAWQIANSGDYNGDGYADVFWRNSTTGQNIIHLMRGPSVIAGSGQLNRVSDMSWRITGR